MSHLLRSEWIKFRSVRSTVITLLIGGALVVLVAGLAARDATSTTQSCRPAGAGETTTADDLAVCGDGFVLETTAEPTNLTGLTGGVSIAALIFGTLGVQVIASEYRFNTIRPTFTAAPRRRRVMLAKGVVVTLACAVVATVMVALCWAIGATMAQDFVVDDVDRRVAWAIVVFTALWTVGGVGIGAIVRQPVAGILVVALVSIVEQILGNLVSATQRWLPFSNGFQMMLRQDDATAGGLMDLLPGGIYFGVVCVALFVIGTVLVVRRDA